MPASPEELRLIKEHFADLFVKYQQGSIDLPDALIAVRDFTIPSEDGGTPPPPSAEPGSGDDGGGTGDHEGEGAPAGGEPPVPGAPADPPPAEPDPAVLAQAEADLDAALELALNYRA